MIGFVLIGCVFSSSTTVSEGITGRVNCSGETISFASLFVSLLSSSYTGFVGVIVIGLFIGLFTHSDSVGSGIVSSSDSSHARGALTGGITLFHTLPVSLLGYQGS
ncbi:hypothetical protein KA405_03795 [Patescibacteria group bacterium]|nr:hypothetical protein [Patescibacteria group bacterium]